MIRWLLAALALLALALPAAAQPTAPPVSAQNPVYTYCWNGTSVAICGSPGTSPSVGVLQQGPWTLSQPDADVGLDQTYTAAFTTTAQSLTFATTGFGSISVVTDFTSGVGTLAYQEGPTNSGPWSNTRCLTDNANANISTSASVLSSTVTTSITCPVQSLYFHIVANPVTSGTINVTAMGRFVPKQTAIQVLKSPATFTRIMSAATTNATPVAGSPALLYQIFACNSNAAARTVHVYNTNGTPTAGSGTPVISVLVPPANCSPTFGVDRSVLFPSGIGLTITAGFVDSDAVAVAAGDVSVTVLWATSP
jgi:hypothetical protein